MEMGEMSSSRLIDYRLRSLIPFFLVHFFESIGREGGKEGVIFYSFYALLSSITQSSYTFNNTSHQLPHSFIYLVFIHPSILPQHRTSTILPSHSPPSTTTTTTIARQPNKRYGKQAASYNLVPYSTRYPPSRKTYPRRI